MRMKKLFSVAAALLLLSSCGTFEKISNGSEAPTEYSVTSETSALSAMSEETTVAETDAAVSLPTYNETDIGETVYNAESVSVMYEAEGGTLKGYSAAMSQRDGYSGSGYVTGASLPDSELIIELSIPSSQHYNITICAASDTPVDGVLYVDGLARGKIHIKGSGEFESVKYENIYLVPSSAAVSIGMLTGECDIDFVLLEDSQKVYEHDYSLSGILCTENPSAKSALLYKYLCELYGETVLSAQLCTEGTNQEIESAAMLTGKYPAIRFGELMGYSLGFDTGDIELAIEYYKSGGLVGYVWNWQQNGSCRYDESGFELKNAVTDHDAAHLSYERLCEVAEGGGVSKECLEIVNGIDLIAAQLKKLKENDIPVLFRPLPEAGNGEFWWGRDKSDYLWLYKLIYTRLIEYHKLDNIIWVWNAQNVDWYVGDDYCDIMSLDIYDFSGGEWDNQSHINAMLRLYNLSQTKPCSISECNVLPSPANVVKDDAFWMYTCVCSSSIFGEESADVPSKDFISQAEWIMFYNCSAVTTREELIELSLAN